MDWQGQKVAELVMQIMLLASAFIALLIGYFLGSFQMMMLIYASGVVLTSLITVPNWPFFNRHPLNWLDPIEADKHPKPISSPPISTSSKKKSRVIAFCFQFGSGSGGEGVDDTDEVHDVFHMTLARPQFNSKRSV
ncbi:hypothetical protein ACFE04_024594 [Oxalis oulophora]